MKKDKYLNEIEKRLSQLFIVSKEGYKPAPIEKQRLEGYLCMPE